ncbi:hypothetical protein TNCV_1629761 [Trichonephila clavipes]|uniref:Uncharacterized protein n=1 Tax=Trichonephila clavipes TaxID=2585209 RepID=A0A8X6W9Y1_TRICX|nr:hypothetical protein TNCV_1629761 [Trichonephila clavipes]
MQLPIIEDQRESPKGDGKTGWMNLLPQKENIGAKRPTMGCHANADDDLRLSKDGYQLLGEGQNGKTSEKGSGLQWAVMPMLMMIY